MDYNKQNLLYATTNWLSSTFNHAVKASEFNIVNTISTLIEYKISMPLSMAYENLQMKFSEVTLKDFTRRTLVIMDTSNPMDILTHDPEISSLGDGVYLIRFLARVVVSEDSHVVKEPSVKEEKQTKEYTCCICMENKINIVFLPCGHAICCSQCPKVDICPTCRAKIEVHHRLYLG